VVAWGRNAAVESGRGLEAGGSGATLAVVRAGGRGGVAVACSEQLAADGADGGDAGTGVRQSLTPGVVLSNLLNWFALTTSPSTVPLLFLQPVMVFMPSHTSLILFSCSFCSTFPLYESFASLSMVFTWSSALPVRASALPGPPL